MLMVICGKYESYPPQKVGAKKHTRGMKDERKDEQTGSYIHAYLGV